MTKVYLNIVLNNVLYYNIAIFNSYTVRILNLQNIYFETLVFPKYLIHLIHYYTGLKCLKI